jgi:hypothetical protein
MIGPIEVLRDVINKFEKAKIEYFVVGSIAAMYYARPRYTNDIDLVAKIRPEQISDFEILFPWDDYYCPPLEILKDEVTKRGQFNLIHQSSGIKVDVVLTKNTEFSLSEFGRRKKVKFLPNLEVTIASPEDIILKKLDFFRQGGSEKHLEDIRGILTETKIDQDYLNLWILKLGLSQEWEKI